MPQRDGSTGEWLCERCGAKHGEKWKAQRCEGGHGAPAITVEQARLAHRLGIAWRKSDGKYGFKLPCPVCGKPVADSCFCAETIEGALKARQSREAPWPCSRKCVFAWDSHWDNMAGEVQEFFNSRFEPGDNGFIEIQDDLVKALKLPVHKSEQYYVRWPKRWLPKLRKSDPPLYRRVIEHFGESHDPSDYEPWEDDEGEIENCACEI